MSHHDEGCAAHRMEAAVAIDLAAAVDYSPGSIVSRTLHETPSGSLIVFSFAAGERLTEHTSTKDAVILALEGAVDVTVGGKRNHLTAGAAVLMPAHVPHAVDAPEACKFLLALLAPGPKGAPRHEC